MAIPSEPAYDALWPLGPSALEPRALNDRLGDLSGKTIAEFWDYLFHGEHIFPLLRRELSQRFPGIKFVTYDVFGNLHGARQRDLIAKVPDLLREHKVDGVISMLGA
jgi:hypothetical protein